MSNGCSEDQVDSGQLGLHTNAVCLVLLLLFVDY